MKEARALEEQAQQVVHCAAARAADNILPGIEAGKRTAFPVYYRCAKPIDIGSTSQANAFAFLVAILETGAVCRQGCVLDDALHLAATIRRKFTFSSVEACGNPAPATYHLVAEGAYFPLTLSCHVPGFGGKRNKPAHDRVKQNNQFDPKAGHGTPHNYRLRAAIIGRAECDSNKDLPSAASCAVVPASERASAKSRKTVNVFNFQIIFARQ
jgi:hypothetical protein